MFRPAKAANKKEEPVKTDEQPKENVKQEQQTIVRGGGGPRLTSPEAVKSGIWNIDNLLNPHPVTDAAILNPHPVTDAAILNPHPVSLSTLLNPHPVTQLTRTNFLTKPEREDLISLGGVASPNNAGVQIVAGVAGQKVKVFDAGYEALAAGLHYFYFGTSTTATTKRFMVTSTIGTRYKTLVQPRIGDSGDGLYLFSAVSETNMPYDVGYVQE